MCLLIGLDQEPRPQREAKWQPLAAGESEQIRRELTARQFVGKTLPDSRSQRGPHGQRLLFPGHHGDGDAPHAIFLA
jgi:hypothetical protein